MTTNNKIEMKIETSTAEINTMDQLAQSLAAHTRFISDEIIMPAFKQSRSRDYKPIIEFFHSVKKHLIHDLSYDEFADLYAQTLTFGLFTAVILTKGKRKFKRTDLLKTIPKTNIVLHELFEYISKETIPTQLKFIVNRIISDLQQMKSPRRGEPQKVLRTISKASLPGPTNQVTTFEIPTNIKDGDCVKRLGKPSTCFF
jgi:hypothetical protein